MVGGFEKASGRTTAVMERYDLDGNRWKRLRPIPPAVNNATSVAHRGRLYVHGGYTERRAKQSAVRRLYEYTPRAAHALAVLGGRLQAAGGANATGSIASMDVYSLLGGPQPGFHFDSTVEYLDVP